MDIRNPFIAKLVDLAIEEDLGYGDVTAECTVAPELQGFAEIYAKQPLVVSGGGLVSAVAARVDPLLDVVQLVPDGTAIDSQVVISTLLGSSQSLLKVERTVLNFLQRMSGITTATKEAVEGLESLVLLDTRKTTPGWRMLEKYAVRLGGARNHRTSLGDMLLIKNNHIDANGGCVATTLQRAFEMKGFYCPVEVEVRSMDELKAALEFPVTVVMLDNMDNEQLKEAVVFIDSHATSPLIEASGGITPERLPALEKIGVHSVSMGALTTQATNVDISMRVHRREGRGE